MKNNVFTTYLKNISINNTSKQKLKHISNKSILNETHCLVVLTKHQ